MNFSYCWKTRNTLPMLFFPLRIKKGGRKSSRICRKRNGEKSEYALWGQTWDLPPLPGMRLCLSWSHRSLSGSYRARVSSAEDAFGLKRSPHAVPWERLAASANRIRSEKKFLQWFGSKIDKDSRIKISSLLPYFFWSRFPCNRRRVPKDSGGPFYLLWSIVRDINIKENFLTQVKEDPFTIGY
jgi:hypothetical protein